ncbi:MAG: hypothetical protein U0169_02125 [Polyangiaceae bacterium]
MSSTTRGNRSGSKGKDFYPTPSWCVDRLLERLHLPGGVWLEPCAGAGAIIDAVSTRREDVSWFAVEKDLKHAAGLKERVGARSVRIMDARDLTTAGLLRTEPTLTITNPPFNIWSEIKDAVIELAAMTVMLLSIDMLGSAERNMWMRVHAPDVYVIPDRPSFTGKGTDSNSYAWFVWHRRRRRRSGRIEVLRLTPREVRNAGRRQADRTGRRPR